MRVFLHIGYAALVAFFVVATYGYCKHGAKGDAPANRTLGEWKMTDDEIPACIRRDANNRAPWMDALSAVLARHVKEHRDAILVFDTFNRDANNKAPWMDTVIGGTNFCGHGVMAATCPTCKPSPAPCPYCAGGRTGYASTDCENCMNTRLANPTLADLKPGPAAWVPPWDQSRK